MAALPTTSLTHAAGFCQAGTATVPQPSHPSATDLKLDPPAQASKLSPGPIPVCARRVPCRKDDRTRAASWAPPHSPKGRSRSLLGLVSREGSPLSRAHFPVPWLHPGTQLCSSSHPFPPPPSTLPTNRTIFLLKRSSLSPATPSDHFPNSPHRSAGANGSPLSPPPLSAAHPLLHTRSPAFPVSPVGLASGQERCKI